MIIIVIYWLIRFFLQYVNGKEELAVSITGITAPLWDYGIRFYPPSPQHNGEGRREEETTAALFVRKIMGLKNIPFLSHIRLLFVSG